MSEHRKQILQMLSEGKISASEAERLIAATEQPTGAGSSDQQSVPKSRPKYLRVVVDSEDDGGHDGPTKVNVRVPMQLLRAGVKLAGLLPASGVDSRESRDAGAGDPDRSDADQAREPGRTGRAPQRPYSGRGPEGSVQQSESQSLLRIARLTRIACICKHSIHEASFRFPAESGLCVDTVRIMRALIFVACHIGAAKRPVEVGKSFVN